MNIKQKEKNTLDKYFPKKYPEGVGLPKSPQKLPPQQTGVQQNLKSYFNIDTKGKTSTSKNPKKSKQNNTLNQNSNTISSIEGKKSTSKSLPQKPQTEKNKMELEQTQLKEDKSKIKQKQQLEKEEKDEEEIQENDNQSQSSEKSKFSEDGEEYLHTLKKRQKQVVIVDPKNSNKQNLEQCLENESLMKDLNKLLKNYKLHSKQTTKKPFKIGEDLMIIKGRYDYINDEQDMQTTNFYKYLFKNDYTDGQRTLESLRDRYRKNLYILNEQNLKQIIEYAQKYKITGYLNFDTNKNKERICNQSILNKDQKENLKIVQKSHPVKDPFDDQILNNETEEDEEALQVIQENGKDKHYLQTIMQSDENSLASHPNTQKKLNNNKNNNNIIINEDAVGFSDIDQEQQQQQEDENQNNQKQFQKKNFKKQNVKKKENENIKINNSTTFNNNNSNSSNFNNNNNSNSNFYQQQQFQNAQIYHNSESLDENQLQLNNNINQHYIQNQIPVPVMPPQFQNPFAHCQQSQILEQQQNKNTLKRKQPYINNNYNNEDFYEENEENDQEENEQFQQTSKKIQKNNKINQIQNNNNTNNNNKIQIEQQQQFINVYEELKQNYEITGFKQLELQNNSINETIHEKSKEIYIYFDKKQQIYEFYNEQGFQNKKDLIEIEEILDNLAQKYFYGDIEAVYELADRVSYDIDDLQEVSNHKRQQELKIIEQYDDHIQKKLKKQKQILQKIKKEDDEDEQENLENKQQQQLEQLKIALEKEILLQNADKIDYHQFEWDENDDQVLIDAQNENDKALKLVIRCKGLQRVKDRIRYKDLNKNFVL